MIEIIEKFGFLIIIVALGLGTAIAFFNIKRRR